MISLTAKTKAAQHNIDIPTGWQEVTTGLFQSLAREWDGSDQVKLFSILSGQHYDGVRNTKSKNLEELFFRVIAFVFVEPMDWKGLPKPNAIKIGDKVVLLPADLGMLSIGQAIAVREKISAYANELKQRETVPVFVEGFYMDALISFAMAVYLQPLVDGGDFDMSRVSAIEVEIAKMPILETYAIGFFFLNRYQAYGQGQTQGWRRWIGAVSTMKMKLAKWLGGISWRRSKTDFTLTGLPNGIVLTLIMFTGNHFIGLWGS